MNFSTRNGFHLLQINAQDGANLFALPFTQCVDAAHSHLAPAPRRTAQVHNPSAGHQEAIFVIKFQNFKRRTTTIALNLSPLDIGVIELTLQPNRGRQFPTTSGFHLHTQFTLAAATVVGRDLRHVIQLFCSRNTPSALICA